MSVVEGRNVVRVRPLHCPGSSVPITHRLGSKLRTGWGVRSDERRVVEEVVYGRGWILKVYDSQPWTSGLIDYGESLVRSAKGQGTSFTKYFSPKTRGSFLGVSLYQKMVRR